jgi:CheY-like chemotaxis protein
MRIRQVTRRLLTLSQQRPAQPRPTDLHSVVHEGLQLLRASLPATIELHENHAPEPAVVRADATQLHQVLLNLGTNAHHAMSALGGTLVVAVDRYEVSAAEASAPDRPPSGRYARMRVSDTGTGIDPEVRERMFEPYFTTRSRGEGSGLGLAVVHGIVSSIDGSVTVESAPGQGSTFTVWLPLSEAPAAKPARPRAAPRGGGERLLIVDDEVSIVNVCAAALKSAGYRVTATSDSPSALEQVRADPGAFDLLISDDVMPELSGRRLAAEVRALRPDLPVLLVSGGGFGATDGAAAVDELLSKPFSVIALLDAVRRLLDARTL